MSMPISPAAIVLLLVSGCGLLSDSSTFRVGNITVIDDAGLVTAADGEAPTLAGVGDEPVVVRGESLTEVLVYWTGTSCADWTVRLGGNALTLSIQPGQVEPGCVGDNRLHAVRLDLDRAVDATDIEVTQAAP